MSDATKVGIVGLGNSGWHYHAQGTLEHSPEFDIVATSARSEDRARAAAERFGARPHSTWEDLVHDPEVDLVVVATPHHLHAPVTIAALAAGKHVVVEKPMAMTTVETSAMLAAAQDHDRLLTVFQNRRWEPTFTIVRELVDSGEIGDVWRVEERRMHAGRYVVAGDDRPHAGAAIAEWAHRPDGGGGVSYLIAPHLIDHQLLLHGGAPVSVSAIMHTFPGDAVEHYLDLRLTFPGGRQSRVEIFRENVLDLPKWAVFGSDGTIICPDFTTVRLERASGKAREYSGLKQLQACDDFYAGLALALRGEGPAPVDPREGADVVAVLEAAHTSARQGGEVVEIGPRFCHGNGP